MHSCEGCGQNFSGPGPWSTLPGWLLEMALPSLPQQGLKVCGRFFQVPIFEISKYFTCHALSLVVFRNLLHLVSSFWWWLLLGAEEDAAKCLKMAIVELVCSQVSSCPRPGTLCFLKDPGSYMLPVSYIKKKSLEATCSNFKVFLKWLTALPSLMEHGVHCYFYLYCTVFLLMK